MKGRALPAAGLDDIGEPESSCRELNGSCLGVIVDSSGCPVPILLFLGGNLLGLFDETGGGAVLACTGGPVPAE